MSNSTGFPELQRPPKARHGPEPIDTLRTSLTE